MKKKIIAVILIWVMVLVWLVIATILTIKFLGTGAVKTEKLTITFDSDGGTPVEKITFEKGTMVELPTPTKEGFEFDNWSVVKGGGEGFSETVLTDYWTKFLRGDVYVKALWKELQANEMVMTINFDAQGGKISGNNSKTSQSVVKCVDNAYTVEGLPTATKDGYTFMSWADQHGTPILNGASLVCSETLNLYATYQKNDGEKWTCDDGSTPDSDHKCKVYMTPDKRCPSNTTEIKGVCIDKNTITAGNTNKDKIVRTCGKSTVIVDNNGHTQEVQGELAYVGDSWEKAQYYYCVYGPTSESQYECTSTGHKWISVLNKCYRSKGEASANISYSCSQGDYIYLSTNEVNSLRQNANINGCFKITNRESYCSDSSYTLEGEYCIKKVDAKKSN